MRFYSTPLREIRDEVTKRIIVVFDNKGVYDTDNEGYIRRLKRLAINPAMKIRFDDVETTPTPTETPNTQATDTPKTYKCQKCDAEFEKPLELAQHSRKFHKKGK